MRKIKMEALKCKMTMKKYSTMPRGLMSAIVFCLLVFPLSSFAQTVSLKSDKTEYNKGDSFLVTASLDAAGYSINSIGGTVLIPADRFDVSQIETGGSFVSLWVKRPELTAGNASSTAGPKGNYYRIDFSGGLPGGYSGSNGTIFSFVLRAKEAGLGKLDLNGLEAFLNDGKGTAVPSIKSVPLNMSIANNASLPRLSYTAKIDTTPPEPFDVSLSKDASVAGNKYFVSFFAVDKGTGVAKYEVEEDPWVLSWFRVKKIWNDSESPQVMYYQKWVSTVKVRAYDAAGNVREEKTTKFF